MNKPFETDINELLKQAKEKVDKMSEQEYADMLAAQRESFVRAMTTGCEHGILDFESCPKCRGG